MKFFFITLFLTSFVFANDVKNLAMLETEAKKHLGGDYFWSGVTPETGFDCSGYTKYVYNKLGINLPRTALEQANIGKEISKDELEKGDLVFFLTDAKRGISITHVGIYLGNNEFIHAASSKEGIITSSLSGKYKKLFVKATRPNNLNKEEKTRIMSKEFFAIEYKAIHSPTKIEIKYNFYSLNGGKYTKGQKND
mgnify:CR=1 FL=1